MIYRFPIRRMCPSIRSSAHRLTSITRYLRKGPDEFSRSVVRHLPYFRAMQPTRSMPNGTIPASIVTVIPDDRHGVALVTVRGIIETSISLDLLRECRDMESRRVHIDLHDALILTPDVMAQLESAVDRIEARGLNVRIVGLDPAHPLLVS